jgi:serralysin
MAGGDGDDVYVVDKFGTSVQNRDLVIEQANEGFDTVRSYVSFYELPLHTENLEVHATQDGTYIGSGNLENNIVQGVLLPDVRASFRLFAGYGGSDTLIGNIYDDELSAIDTEAFHMDTPTL